MVLWGKDKTFIIRAAIFSGAYLPLPLGEGWGEGIFSQLSPSP